MISPVSMHDPLFLMPLANMYHLYRRISNCLLCVRGAVSLSKEDKEKKAYGFEHMGQGAYVLRLRYARDFFEETQTG